MNQYWIISKGTVIFNYLEPLQLQKFNDSGSEVLVTLFVYRSYIFDAYMDGQQNPPLSQLTGSNNLTRVVCTDGSTAQLKLPSLVTGYSGTEGKDYFTIPGGGVYQILSRTQAFSKESRRWTTHIQISGIWDKAKNIAFTSTNLRTVWRDA